MFRTPSHLSEQSRVTLVDELNARLCDCCDLFSQIKVAHWNIKGPQFSALHPLFETFGQRLCRTIDCVAERCVTLGGVARGTSRHVAKHSVIPEYPQDTIRDLEHVRLLAERFDKCLVGLKTSRETCIKLNDQDSMDMLNVVIRDMERDNWFLLAHLEGQR
jgi:starvation-inducible DNA-binding protein